MLAFTTLYFATVTPRLSITLITQWRPPPHPSAALSASSAFGGNMYMQNPRRLCDLVFVSQSIEPQQPTYVLYAGVHEVEVPSARRLSVYS